MNTLLLTGLIIGIISILLGLSVYKFRLDWMISGYNTLTKDKKANIDIDKIRLLFRNFFVIGGLILILNFIISLMSEIKFIHPIGIFLIITLFLITNYLIGKYDRNKKGGMPSLYRLFHRK